jgi:hypothetical protein
VRIALVETFGFLGTWLRLLWRHWPVLLALALAGGLARQLLISQTVDASKWRDGLGGLLLFPLVPAAVLIAMVLMLRVMRSSLPYLGPRSRPESMLVYLASVLIPFLAFYFTAGYATYDLDMYAHRNAVVASQEVFASVLTDGTADVQTKMLYAGAVVVAIAAGAFLLRWVLERFKIVRRLPYLAIPALYLEVLWIYTAFRAGNEYLPKAQTWLGNTRIWHAATGWAGDNAAAGEVAAAQSYVDFGTAAFTAVLVAPVAALVAGSVVLAARHTAARTVPASGLRRVLHVGEQAGRPIAGNRFALIADALRRVFQAGLPATMVFCLGFICVQAVPAFLAAGQRPLIGERDPDRVWPVIEFPLRFINEAIGLVLLMALIAAFVDRTARRIARRAGAPTTPPAAAPDGAATDADRATTTLSLSSGGYDGDRTQWTPVPGALEQTQRVPAPGEPQLGGSTGLPQRTPYGQQPQPGQQQPYGQQPPPYGTERTIPPPPSAWPPPPPGARDGLRDGTGADGNEDVPRQTRLPDDPDSGWSAFGR